MIERLLNSAVDRQGQCLPASSRIRQKGVECAFHPGNAVPVNVGVADDMGSEARLGVEPVWLAIDCKARLADRIDRLDQRRGGTAAEIEERFIGAEESEILLLAIFRHQLRKTPGERELITDHLVRMNGDRPRIDRSRQRVAVPVDDIATLRNVGSQFLPTTGMIAERREVEDAKGYDG